MIPRIQPCLCFDGNAEEAADFYAATFADTRIDKINRAPGDYPDGKQGGVLTIEMMILGKPFLLLNGGASFTFSDAMSFQVSTEDQAETDRYWKAITEGGGQEIMCGWCKDRFGLCWQITPRRLIELVSGGGEQAERAFKAMMEMKKIDIAALEKAVAGS